jgi:hypothetical protein
VQALSAVSDRLRASSGRFFFGAQPSSLDALLWGHLAFYAHSPVAAPVLRDKVGGAVQGSSCLCCGAPAHDAPSFLSLSNVLTPHHTPCVAYHTNR